MCWKCHRICTRHFTAHLNAVNRAQICSFATCSRLSHCTSCEFESGLCTSQLGVNNREDKVNGTSDTCCVSIQHLKANYITTPRKGCPTPKAPSNAAHKCSFWRTCHRRPQRPGAHCRIYVYLSVFVELCEACWKGNIWYDFACVLQELSVRSRLKSHP